MECLLSLTVHDSKVELTNPHEDCPFQRNYALISTGLLRNGRVCWNSFPGTSLETEQLKLITWMFHFPLTPPGISSVDCFFTQLCLEGFLAVPKIHIHFKAWRFATAKTIQEILRAPICSDSALSVTGQAVRLY